LWLTAMSQVCGLLFCPEMTFEAYEQTTENTVSPRIVSSDDKGAKGDVVKRERAGAIGRQFGAGKCSSARSAIEKIRREIFGGNKRVKDLREVSTNSQQQN